MKWVGTFEIKSLNIENHFSFKNIPSDVTKKPINYTSANLRSMQIFRKKRYIMVKIFLAFSEKTFNFQYENSSIPDQLKLASIKQVFQADL